MFDKLLYFFDQRQWVYNILGSNLQIISFGFKTDKANYNCYATINPSNDILTIIIYHPIVVPKGKAKRDQILALCNHYNANLILGNFDITKGNEIRCRTSTIIGGDKLEESVISEIINWSINLMDDTLDTFNNLIYEKIDVKGAIERADSLFTAPTKSLPEA
ncbi:hypothetical protein GO755_30430 [Spirosoma sp. HMF4905]|uniref:YbjN domain-containing protein n=1 Tax=Spirosoma arboris TaxID=2682092 RepID=A0A7K1SKV6_9BACT|nr:YbjN domain-containing protein [Spirosoma arboris]MVM34388.1 hypothetical protein [Spirosoma arboris]